MASGHVSRSGLLLALAAMLCGQLLLLSSSPASAVSSLPPGFVLRDTPTGQGPYNLTDFAYLPDGSVLTAGKNGRVTWVPLGGAPRTIAQLDTDPVSDLGLVGLALARDYDRTGHVYAIRSIPTSAPPWILRLSRFTVSGGDTPSGLVDESVLFEIESAAWMHGMTTVVAAPDGTLWVSVGDLQFATTVYPDALKALDLDEPAGKLLHITADGRGVASNPYYDAAQPRSWRSRTYASGFRSPFRFSLDPSTGNPVLGDVGWRTWEELDIVEPGHSYAWPCWEGAVRTPGYGDLPGCAKVSNTPPLWSYRHGSGSAEGNSVVAGGVYTGQNYPARYRGAFFYGDYTTNKLWTLRYDDAGKLVTVPQDPPFGVDIGGPVKFAAASNGDIVYADLVSGALRRLTYTPGNTAPVAHADTSTDPETRTVTFSAERSMDFDGDELTYAWSFGDGATASGLSVTHRYVASGDRFTAKLTVTDPFGASDTVSVVVAPSNHSPVLQLTTPGDTTFAVGEAVKLAASARDEEDGALSVTWRAGVLHCAQASTCHLHPGAASTGPAWSGQFPAHEESSMQVTATVTDSEGVVGTETYLARPRLRLLRLVSNVPAVIEVPGFSPGSTAHVTEGLKVEVVAAKVAHDGVATFRRWQDGVTYRTRTITVEERDITLSATYRTPIGWRYARDPRLRKLLGGPVAPEVGRAVRHRRYERGRLYWSEAAGVHEIHGRILLKYLAAGGHRRLGAPLTDERSGGDGVGRYSSFAERASIYWKPSTGAHVVRGKLRRAWRRAGGVTGALGYPVTDHRKTKVGRGRFVNFEKDGAVYWSPKTGAHALHGPIWRKWSAIGKVRSPLGFPTTGVRKVRGGARAEFQNGVIRWYSATRRTVVRRS
ncbi:MAG TPA: PQQ-dependent sugar dehydrogenase [Nocardioidaceae bacterium]|nr:PQQ-dependent sugar dehydrogenase [Nocardioidaceae bacterium]